jgi:membrane-associated phospholipid phosphatase
MSFPGIDKLGFFFINRDLHNRFFDIFMPFITDKSYLFFLPVLLWFLLKERKHALTVLALAFASLLISDWGANILKHFFERARPCNALEGVRTLVGCTGSFSMPSNHAVNAFAFITPFCSMLTGRLRYILVVLAFLIGFSRVYVGVHYPSDVIAGALFGVFLATGLIKGYEWSFKRYKVKPYTTLLFVFLLAISLFRIYFILNSPFDLSPDEAHYWEWSRRLDISYYSKGPMIAYLIHLGTFIFGDTVFGVRFMAVMSSLLGSVFLYIFGKGLYDEQVGLSSALIMQIIPLFSVFGVLFTIDSPFIFFWILSLFFFWRSINSQSQIANRKPQIYWLLLGLSIGLGLLTKYTMAFFYICAFLFLALSNEYRKLLFTKNPYIAFLVSLLVFSPVLIWNADHDWVTFRHTAGQAHIADGIQISFQSLFEFLGSQFGVITPILLLLMIVSLWKLRKKPEGHFLFWFSVPVVLFFSLKSIQGKVQANWALPGYITGIVAFSAFYIKRFFSGSVGKKILIASSVIISLIATSVVHYPAMLNLPVSLDPAAKLEGWKELGTKVSDIYKQMSSGHPVFIFSDSYQTASELAFYVKGHPVTYCVNIDRRMNQYDLWPGFNSLYHYDAIFVMTDDSEVPEKVASAFEKIEKKVFTAYTKKHTKLKDYSIFMCYDFKGLKEEKTETY